MSNPSDDIAMKVLSEINSRTLVNGAGIDPGLISSALDISSSDLRPFSVGLNIRAWCGWIPTTSPVLPQQAMNI